jgi:hypothetical protein
MMTKKHWIYIKRGLSEDPKHRAAMGECIWLYMHIIDRADWETGIAYDWKDEDEASEMDMPVKTLRNQRRKLEELDYIRCKQRQYGQNVAIMEWKNPRDYGSETKNPRVEGSLEQAPSEIQGDHQGYRQGYHQVSSQKGTPTSSSESKSSKLKRGDPLDGILDYQLRPKSIQDALRDFFRLTPNWETKFNREFMQWAVAEKITPEQVKAAAELWRSDKRFNWSVPSLKGIQEHWLELMDPSGFVPPQQTQGSESVGEAVARQWLARKQQEAANG